MYQQRTGDFNYGIFDYGIRDGIFSNFGSIDD